MAVKPPEHVAIIMDGNGRWAKARHRPRTYGHIQGARVAKKIITAAAEAKVKFLTLFAFSTENWFRPETEVRFLMRILAHQLKRERKTLQKNNISFRVIGDLNSLPAEVRAVVVDTIALTAENTGMTLVFALSFGGRQEIAAAARAVAAKVQAGQLAPEDIDESTLAAHLDSTFLPNPDLILRTSGERRLSNFFLWSSAYSEIYFLDKQWPDFTAADLHQAMADYARTERRFGRVDRDDEDSVAADHSGV